MRTLLLLLAFAGRLAAAPQDADQLFEKGRYQEALTAYSAAASDKDPDGLRALYRSVECEALLSRYAEAYQRIAALKLPSDPLWRARFAVLRAELGREYLDRYRYNLPQDEQRGTKDVTRLTLAQWKGRIAADYEVLWELRRDLVSRRLAEEGYFVDIDKANLEETPTLWDFAVTRWIEFLKEERGVSGKTVDAGLLAVEEYKYDYSTDLGPGAKLAALYEESAALPAKGRETAAARYRIQRVMAPWHRSDLFPGYSAPDYSSAARKVLEKWLSSMESPKARVQAGHCAASIAESQDDLAGVVGYCRQAESIAPRDPSAQLCVMMRESIEEKSLEIGVRPAPPPGKDLIRLSVRNLPAVWFRLYRTSPEELKGLDRADTPSYNSLRYLNEPVASAFLDRKPDQAWKTELAYPVPYKPIEKKVQPPPLGKGLYVLIAGGDENFARGESQMRAAVVNITDIFLLGTAGVAGDPEKFLYSDPAGRGKRTESPELFHFYAVNALTGRPAGDAPIQVYHGSYSGGGIKGASLRTDGGGRAALTEPLAIEYNRHQYFQADPLLSYGGAYALWSHAQGSGYAAPQPIEVKVETDRPAYRPGQKVLFKATVLERVPGGYRVYRGKSKLTVRASDAGWQEFFRKDLPLNSMGSASGSFDIPAGRVLGQYRFSAAIAEYGGSFSGEAGFLAEEYKRPEFEVTLKEAAGPLRYGQKAVVAGSVKYYFGSPVPGAEVKYTVKRSRFVPWYAWWYSWFYAPSGSAEFASGTARTGDDGAFTAEFTPAPESDAFAQYPSSFEVAAEARDAGGRTITASRSYTAGAKAYSFDVTPDAGFFTSDSKAGFRARLLNLGGAQCAGEGSYAVYRLEKIPDFPKPAGWGGYFGRTPPLEQVFAQVPDGPQAAQGGLAFSEEKPSQVKLKALPEGVYRLRLKVKDPWGGEAEAQVILVSADPAAKASSLKLPPVVLFERAVYQPGETVRALIGAEALKGAKFVETLAGDYMLSKRTLDAGGVSLLSFKAGDEHRGGFALRWFGAGDFSVYSAQSSASVPRNDRRLSVTLDHEKALKPGQKASWAVKAAGPDGKPVDGEATVRIFDRSLEYYAKQDEGWQGRLFPERVTYSNGVSSLFDAGVFGFSVKRGGLDAMLGLFTKAELEERTPSLRLTAAGNSRLSLGYRMASKPAFESNEAMLMEDEAPAGGLSMAKSAAMPAIAPAPQGGAGLKRRDSSAAAPSVQVRKDFSETALFAPHLQLKGGRAPLSFRIPERLTSWKVTAAVLTPDVKTGAVSAETVTRKDLMARLDIPRFLREGDESVITAVLSSQAGGELAGEASLAIARDGADAGAAFSLGASAQPFSLKPGGTVSLKWPVKAPGGVAAYKVRVVARAGALSDGQENDLPVLPSRERLVASRFAALDGKSEAKLELAELKAKDDTREVEALHLEVQPQLILTVLNSLPFLVQYPHECTEQLLNRYVPLAITNGFYTRYPALAEAVKKIPRRATLTPAWERDNPVRQMTLMETPWEAASQGDRTSLPSIDLLDAQVVAQQKEGALKKLEGYQNSDGGYPWFPGGRSNLYITLNVLDGWAEAARYGVAVPRAAARKALDYVLREIPDHMKPDPEETSFILYAAYVVTSFPKDWPETARAKEPARAWAKYADGQADSLTAFGKAYAAYVWLRLGDAKKAASYLDRAMDGSREDEISGVYWAPEKISWVWYNDTLEKHAFILRALLAVRPEDPRVPGMVKWLLFNRKSGSWKSTKASAAAIYSLLDVMKKKGALDKPEKLSVSWGATADTRELQPFDWVERPLRWSKYGAEAQAAPVGALVKKDGPGLAFALLTGVYTTTKPVEESPGGMLNVSRKYFRRVREGEAYALKPLASGDTVAVGEQLEVHLEVTARSRFEFVHLKDPKGAGFEGEALTSGWRWDGLGRYEEPRDSLTNFFMDRLPQGEYVLKYRLRPTTPGTYRVGAATLQSMYAPEFAAHSAGLDLVVR